MTDTIEAHCKAIRAETELWMVNPEYFQRQKDLANAVEYETKLLNSVIVAHDYELSELSKQIQSMEDQNNLLEKRIENRTAILTKEHALYEASNRNQEEQIS